MANRFSYGDTLGGQLYTQYVRDSTNRYLQEKALEEERQRREAERRRQEKQRKKASDHGAFGQTLQTIGQIGGAIAGGITTGTPQGAIAGSQLGSAGASTIMNLFPNVGGTEPSGDNPYYNKPSDMAKFSSTLNTGLQAYGMYSQAAAARAKEDLMNEIKADMSRPRMMIDESARLGQSADPNYFDYKNATSQQISDRIKSLPSWQNATGLFGEQLVNDSAALSIANNTYDQISQSAMAGLQFINGLDNNQAKQQALQNWQNTYGQSRSDLIPKYGLESMQQSVQSGMADAAIASETAGLNLDQLKAKTAELKRKIAKAPQDEANALYLQLAEINLKAIQAGAPYNANAFKAIGEMTPEIASAVDGLASAQATAYTAQQQAKTQADRQKAQDRLFNQTLSVMEKIPFEQGELRNRLINYATTNEDMRLLLQNVGPKQSSSKVTGVTGKYTKDQIDSAEDFIKFHRKGVRSEFMGVDGYLEGRAPKTDQQIRDMILSIPASKRSISLQAALEEFLMPTGTQIERSNTRSDLEPVPQQQTQTVSENPDISNSISNLVTDAQSISRAERTPTAETPPVQSAPNPQSNTRPPANAQNTGSYGLYLDYLTKVKGNLEQYLSRNSNNLNVQNLVADIDIMISTMRRAENLPQNSTTQDEANQINFIRRGLETDFQMLASKIKALGGRN